MNSVSRRDVLLISLPLFLVLCVNVIIQSYMLYVIYKALYNPDYLTGGSHTKQCFASWFDPSLQTFVAELNAALLTFLFYVWKHIRETAAMIFYLRCFEWRGNMSVAHEPLRVVIGNVHDKITGRDYATTRPLSRIKVAESFVYVNIVLLKMCVTVATVIVGSGSVIRSATLLDLVFNSLASVFILELDEVVYTIFVARMWSAFTKPPQINVIVRPRVVTFQLCYPYFVVVMLIVMGIIAMSFWCVAEPIINPTDDAPATDDAPVYYPPAPPGGWS